MKSVDRTHRMELYARDHPRQWKNMVFGSVGGSVLGSVAWLFNLAVLSHQWVLFWSTLIVATMVVALTIHRTLARPANYWFNVGWCFLALLVYTDVALRLGQTPEMEAVVQQHPGALGFSLKGIRYFADGFLLAASLCGFGIHFWKKKWQMVEE